MKAESSALPGYPPLTMATTTSSIPQSEFTARRKKLLSLLNNAIGLVFAGDADAHLHNTYRPHAHFEYLTGVTDEAGAILLFDPAHPVEDRRVMLFLKPL